MGAYGSPEFLPPPAATPRRPPPRRHGPTVCGVLVGGCAMLFLELVAFVTVALITYHGRG